MSARVFGDVRVLTGRSLKHISRSPDTIITTAIMPIGVMLLFVYVFGGAIDLGKDAGSKIDYMLPGILLMTIAMGIGYTSYRIFLDLDSGMFDRFRSMPIARSSSLWAHVLTSVLANMVSVAIVVAVAFASGFRSDANAVDRLIIIGILLAFTLALTWVAIIGGLTAKSIEGVSALSYPVVALPFISSAFVPTDSMPAAVAAFAENQPVTPIINTIRALFAGRPTGDDLWVSLLWSTAILLVAYIVAMDKYRRRAG